MPCTPSGPPHPSSSAHAAPPPSHQPQPQPQAAAGLGTGVPLTRALLLRSVPGATPLSLASLAKLDVSLEQLSGLSGLDVACPSLQCLHANVNQLADLRGIEGLSRLQVRLHKSTETTARCLCLVACGWRGAEGEGLWQLLSAVWALRLPVCCRGTGRRGSACTRPDIRQPHTCMCDAGFAPAAGAELEEQRAHAAGARPRSRRRRPRPGPAAAAARPRRQPPHDVDRPGALRGQPARGQLRRQRPGWRAGSGAACILGSVWAPASGGTTRRAGGGAGPGQAASAAGAGQCLDVAAGAGGALPGAAGQALAPFLWERAGGVGVRAQQAPPAGNLERPQQAQS